MPGKSTITVHADREVQPSRAVALPIYQTATFWAEDGETFAQVAVDPRGKDFYTRFGNPNHAQVAAVVAELEGTEAAMVTASGMAALTTAVLALVSAGDHVIGQRSTYGVRHRCCSSCCRGSACRPPWWTRPIWTPSRRH